MQPPWARGPQTGRQHPATHAGYARIIGRFEHMACAPTSTAPDPAARTHRVSSASSRGWVSSRRNPPKTTSFFTWTGAAWDCWLSEADQRSKASHLTRMALPLGAAGTVCAAAALLPPSCWLARASTRLLLLLLLHLRPLELLLLLLLLLYPPPTEPARRACMRVSWHGGSNGALPSPPSPLRRPSAHPTHPLQTGARVRGWPGRVCGLLLLCSRVSHSPQEDSPQVYKQTGRQ